MYILEVTFDINLSTLFALLTGIVCGAILTILIFTLITITNIKKETIIIKRLDHEVDEEDVKKDIEKVKNTYKLKLKEDKEVEWTEEDEEAALKAAGKDPADEAKETEETEETDKADEADKKDKDKEEDEEE